MRPNPLRERWSRGEPASCLWIDIGWPVSVEGLVKLPYDSFTLDLQHSLIDRGTAVSVLQALSLGTGVPLVRVTQNDPAEIGFVLDAGAYGMSQTSNYNTRPRPAEVLVHGATTRVIRRRETMQDLLAPELS